MVKNLPAKPEIWVQSLCGEDPLEKEMATHSNILAWEFHGQRNLAGYSPWGHRDLVITEQLTLFKNQVGCGNTQYGGLGEFLHVFFFRSNRLLQGFPQSVKNETA